jgi:hypothetical protein
MTDIELTKRRNTYSNIAKELSLSNDAELTELLESSTVIGNSIGGSSAVLNFSNTNIFIKKIRLTDIERRPENKMSTANIFNLPLYY